MAEQDSQLYQEYLNSLNKETEEDSCVETLEADLAAAQAEEAELVRELEQQLELAEQDSQLYQEYLNSLNKETEEDSCVETLEADLAAAQEEEAELVRELEQLRVEEKAVEEELGAQTEARARLESEEEEYWRQYSRWLSLYLMV